MPALVRTHLRNTRRRPPLLRTGPRAPLARPHHCFRKDAGGNRTHFDRVAAGCLAVWLQRQVSSSGVEPDLRPSQGRVRSATPRGHKAPRRGIEPRLAVSKTAVPSVTPAGPNIIPTWSRTRTWTLGESNAIRYTIGTFKSRRLDS